MAGEGLVQILIKFGYEYEGQCQCDGFKTFKYRNKEYQFRWRIKKGTFKMKQHGITKTDWIKISSAETVLKNIHNVAVQA
jgi:hypothetical protein